MTARERCPRCDRPRPHPDGTIPGPDVCILGPTTCRHRAIDWRARCLAAEAKARALVDALPKCDECGEPATRAWGRGGARYCDVHGKDIHGRAACVDVPEYPRAAPLRALVAILRGDP